MAKKSAAKSKVRVITSITVNEMKLLDKSAAEVELTRSQFIRDLIRKSNTQYRRRAS